MSVASSSTRPPGRSVRSLVADVLKIDQSDVVDDLQYQFIPEWDSLQHVALMLALEEELGVEIDACQRVSLSSFRAIREFVAAHGNSQAVVPRQSAPEVDAGRVARGLANVVVDTSRVTRIDGERGELEYRGFSIHELAARATFEEVVYLLVHGHLPAAEQLQALRQELQDARSTVPEAVLELMAGLAGAHPMDALRTGISALGAWQEHGAGSSCLSTVREGIRLIGRVPVLIAAHHAARTGAPLRQASSDASHAAHLLHLLRGEAPTAAEAALIDCSLVVHADHSANASAFTARVVTSCRANVYSAMTAAVSAFAGELHGGAAEGVMRLVDEVGTPDRAHDYVQRKLSENQPVMGFGHRVYRTEDPRVRHLRQAARAASEQRGDMTGYEVIAAVSEAMAPYSRHGVSANVDLYAGLLYRMLGIPNDLAVPMFVAGRTAGWLAQVLEQQANHVLIRPRLRYVGATGRTYPGRGQ